MRKILLYAIAAALFVACSVDTSEDMTILAPDVPEELYVSFDEEDTRIQLKNDCPVWTAGDLVSVFYRSNANDKWQFQGKTGDLDGTLKRLEQGVPTIAASKVIAVYPYSTNYMYVPALELVEASLPGTQNYAKDSFGVGSSIMVASDDYRQLDFKNVCGWIMFQFTGNQTIKTISFRGNSGEQVAGDICIYTEDASCVLASEMGAIGDNGVGGSLDFEDSVLTSVTLDCGEGVTLNKSTATAFYIALPPQTFEKGFAVNLTCVDGTQKEISTENNIVIERNHILPMAAMEVAMEVPNGSATFAANTITWNYLDDAAEDAKIYDNDKNTTASYSREITLATPVNNLPGNMTVEELLAKSGDLVSTKINGVASDAVSISGNETDGYVLHFSNFEWDKTYEIEFAYENIRENNGIKYSATLSTTVTTVGRENVAIKLPANEATIAFQNNLTLAPFAEGVPTVDLKPIYDTIKNTYDISNYADAKTFLADVIGVYGYAHTSSKKIEAYDADGNKIQTITDSTINELWSINDNYEISVGFSDTIITSGPHKVVYTQIITLWYGQQIEIVMTINIKYPHWDFVHNPTLVTLSNGIYSSTITPKRLPYTNSAALTGLGISLDLTEAFSVQDDAGNTLTKEDLDEQGLEVVFVIEDSGTKIDIDENNMLYYYSSLSQTNVRGELYKVNAEAGSKTRITTKFDNDGMYANYVVKTGKFVPFSKPSAKSQTASTNIQVGDKGVFRIHLLDHINFHDFRENSTTYSLIDTNTHSLLIGNGSNGYASGVSVAEMYKINVTATMSDSNSEIITLDNSNNSPAIVLDTTTLPNGMDKDYKCNAIVTIDSPWVSYDIKLIIRFYKTSY